MVSSATAVGSALLVLPQPPCRLFIQISLLVRPHLSLRETGGLVFDAVRLLCLLCSGVQLLSIAGIRRGVLRTFRQPIDDRILISVPGRFGHAPCVACRGCHLMLVPLFHWQGGYWGCGLLANGGIECWGGASRHRDMPLEYAGLSFSGVSVRVWVCFTPSRTLGLTCVGTACVLS